MSWKSGSNKIRCLLCLLPVLLLSCHSKQTPPPPENEEPEQPSLYETAPPDTVITEEESPLWRTSRGELRLTDIQQLDSTIRVDIKYAGTDNFTGRVLYKHLNRAYLQPDVAEKLVKAHQILKDRRPGLRFLVYDAVRPLSVQKEMYEEVKNTPYHLYVATPERTSLHNYAAAVDLTIIDEQGAPLDMGSPYDFFGKAAGPAYETELLEEGILSRQQIDNRLLLREVMQQAGFRSIRGEWWHFNACSLTEAKQKYPLIE